jgi:hypothetical protein
MITIRDRNLQTTAKGPAQIVIPERTAAVPLQSLDFYPTTPDGAAMLGASWEDGSSGICDWVSGRDCQQWLAEAAKTWARGKIRVHIKHGRAVQTSQFGDLCGVQS